MLSRINLIIKAKGLSQSQFASAINIQRSTLSHILSGRNNPSLDFVLKVVEAFPDINLDWLARGVGEMYTNSGVAQHETVIQNKEKSTVLDNKTETINDYPLFSYIPNENSNEDKNVHKGDEIVRERRKRGKTRPESDLERSNPEQDMSKHKTDCSEQDSHRTRTEAVETATLGITRDDLKSPNKVKSVVLLFSDGTYQVLT